MDSEGTKAAGHEQGFSGAGCAECAESPWPHGTGYITTALFGMPGLMGAYALLKKAPLRLPVFAGIWAAIVTVVRKIICCRCDYYGTECSTLMGKWTAMIYEKDEEHPLTTEAFYVDFGLIGASILFPLPQVKKMGARYLATYLFVTLGSLLAIRQLACSRCPIDVCFNNPNFRSRKRS
jgi:hypothetical protein